MEFVQQKYQGKWDIRQAVKRACKASARIIEKLGAQEAIPWADEVDKHPAISELRQPEDVQSGTPQVEASTGEVNCMT